MHLSDEHNSELIARTVTETLPWEVEPPEEANAIPTIVAAIEAQVRAAAQNASARRDAHPKMHACVSAEFRIFDDLPAPLRVGLFEHAGVYQTWIRFSNGNAKPQSDAIGDGRGMAMKLMGVQSSRSNTQDFIMINNPAFFVRNVVDYVEFLTATNPRRFFFPGWNPLKFRLHELSVARAITAKTVNNPLDIQYWSMTPYLFGDIPFKYSVRPTGLVSNFVDRIGPEFLHDNLSKVLQVSSASFDFCIQLCRDLVAMPIEDPTIEWREALSPFVPVARITIPRQDFDSPERLAFGENLSFTPWHGLDAHRPLGGIGRARRTVYETVSRVRHELNGVLQTEPTSFQTI